MRKKSLALFLGLAVMGTAACVSTGIYSYSAGAKQAAQSSQSTAQENTEKVSLNQTAKLVNTSTAGADTTISGVTEVAQNAMPSVVAITSKSVQEVQSYFHGRSYQYESEGAGSGIIVGKNDEELLICTNSHVVEGAQELTVSFADDSSCEAQIKGTDPANDLAVVAVKLADISEDTMDQIKIAQVGDSDELLVGEQVVAIGNALGYGQSVTTGIVSALDRSISIEDGGVSTYDNLIQTDAAINPGNSGGALLNMSGELIGINSAKASSSGVEGMGYAIPVSKAQPILEELMNQETRTKAAEGESAYMGISGQSVSEEATQVYGIPSGVCVTEIEENSAAQNAGLKRGDIITAFDGSAVSSIQELKERLQYYKSGETVELTVQTTENGEYVEETVSITLG